ncbi:MAG: oxaloacetate decarboxylase, partial [Acidobacteria bacterium]
EIVLRLKETVRIPIALHTHATTGMSTAAIVKAVEAGVDYVDTSISSISMTYGHSATESIVTILEGTPRDTGLDLHLLEEIAAYFRKVRPKYAGFEGALKGVDSSILVAQVPGGMFSNMENQLREQGATGRIDEVLAEIPRVREDLGFVPLVTPTSQIVGTQAVLNVLMKQRYKIISKEAAALLRGEYGRTPAPVNAELQKRVLNGKTAVTGRPADHLEPEMERLKDRLSQISREKNLHLAQTFAEDVLTYALFPDVGLRFLETRGNAEALEPQR